MLQMKEQEILQWMNSSSISWTKAELPFNVQNLSTRQACNWLKSRNRWLTLPSKLVMYCIYFIRNTFYYLVSSYYERHTWVPEAILMSHTKQHLLWHLFSSLKWHFWMKTICPALTVLSCWPAWDTPSTACVKNTAFTWARHGQAVVSAASSKHGLYLHQPMFSQALGKKPVHFLTASMYNLHVQLFGGFWSRPSHARTDFAPVESRTKLYSTLTEAEASCESPVTRSFS